MPYKDKEKKREYMKEYSKEWHQRPEVQSRRKSPEHKARKKIANKKYRDRPEVKIRNKARKKEYMKEYRQILEVKARMRIKANEWEKQRKKNSMSYHLLRKLRGALNSAFKRYSKTGKIYSSKKYGINYKTIIEHLKPFPKDIENYHVDHIIPLSLFDFNNPEHIKKVFAPENHQWLTVEQNLEKSNRLIMPCAFG